MDLVSTESRGAIRELLELIHRRVPFEDIESVYGSLVARETIMSTGIGRGVALPHAIVSGLGEICAAVGLSSRGVDFSSPDGSPVGVVILLLFPEHSHRRYIETLAGLSRLFRRGSFTAALNNAHSAESLIDIIERHERLMEDHE